MNTNTEEQESDRTSDKDILVITSVLATRTEELGGRSIPLLHHRSQEG